ncbi:Cell division control protein 1 [Leucoagaricus sp. SymC.cos]|nr:Cell division control protein 1 [Leucoagaricus sp. SymC.cos]
MKYLPPHRRVVNLLRLTWSVLALWYEYFTFRALGRSCPWPDHRTVGLKNVEGTSPAHILIVTDPQILDHRSYPDRPAFLSYLTRLVVDLNLRKNWQAAIAKNPDVVIFLGDMMDNGRMDMSDAEYEEYYSRFKSIFRTKNQAPQYFIPGNHDIGLQSRPAFSRYALKRYATHFGPLNDRFSVANHTLVLFDAPDFVQEDYERAGQYESFAEWRPRIGRSFEFVKKLHDERDSNPLVLFTHIPLYRPDGKSCGSFREKGTIRPGVGFGYQNTLGKHSTAYLLGQLRPTVVFSGDDHDYCEHIHQSVISYPVREITVKSLSMAMNVQRPAFQLLSLFPEPYWDDLHPTYADIPCLLPDQLGIYLNIYIPFLILSLFIVIVAAVTRTRRSLYGESISMAQNPGQLPDPVTKADNRSASVVCFGHRRRLPLGLGNLFRNDRSSKRGLWSHVLRDVGDIAVFPIGVFIVVTLFVSL